jgi:hypothetical protein
VPASATFPATTPTQYPATSYDTWTFELQTAGFNAVAAGADRSTLQPVVATITLKKCRSRADGVLELSPQATDTVVFQINDVLAASDQFPAIATALQSVGQAVVAYIQAQTSTPV